MDVGSILLIVMVGLSVVLEVSNSIRTHTLLQSLITHTKESDTDDSGNAIH